MTKTIEDFHIAQCHICNLAPAMRHCNGCAFNAGIDYWLCDCPENRIRHKGELFCLRCDTDRPNVFNPQPMTKEQIKAELYYAELYD